MSKGTTHRLRRERASQGKDPATSDGQSGGDRQGGDKGAQAGAWLRPFARVRQRVGGRRSECDDAALKGTLQGQGPTAGASAARAAGAVVRWREEFELHLYCSQVPCESVGQPWLWLEDERCSTHTHTCTQMHARVPTQARTQTRAHIYKHKCWCVCLCPHVLPGEYDRQDGSSVGSTCQ